MVRTRRWIFSIVCGALAGIWLPALIPLDAAAQDTPAAKPSAKSNAKSSAKPNAKPVAKSGARSAKPAVKPDVKPAVAATETSNSNPLTQAFNASGQDIFKQLSAEPGNIVLSPYSIGTAMAMVLSGARAQTEAEMKSVLKHGLERAPMDAANAKVMALLKGNPPSAKLLIANALMLTKSGALVADDYVALLRGKYAAELFKNATLDDVNGWVKQKTGGKIEKLLDQLDPQSIAVILNAVYFKATWEDAFNKKVTFDGDFNLSASQKVPVPIMRRSGSYALTAGEGFRAIRLPYSVATLGMVVVLPDEIEGVRAVADKLDAPALGKLLSELRSATATAVDLALPRFAATSKSDLIGVFQKLGMKTPFIATNADFSGLTGKPPGNPPIAIGQIVHSAVVDVNEEGTEAAAATAVEMVARSAAPRQSEQFRVDRPFLFYIVDDKTGAILFQGRIADPR